MIYSEHWCVECKSVLDILQLYVPWDIVDKVNADTSFVLANIHCLLHKHSPCYHHYYNSHLPMNQNSKDQT